MNLIIKLLCGILIGILMGMLAPEIIVRGLITAKFLVSQLIKFTIPLLILFYVTSGIASLPKKTLGNYSEKLLA